MQNCMSATDKNVLQLFQRFFCLVFHFNCAGAVALCRLPLDATTTTTTILYLYVQPTCPESLNIAMSIHFKVCDVLSHSHCKLSFQHLSFFLTIVFRAAQHSNEVCRRTALGKCSGHIKWLMSSWMDLRRKVGFRFHDRVLAKRLTPAVAVVQQPGLPLGLHFKSLYPT